MFDFLAANYQTILLNTARIFSSVFEILLSYLLASSFFTSKLKSRKLDYLPFFMAAAAVIFLQEYLDAGNMKYPAELILLLPVLIFLYDGTAKKKAAGILIFSILVAASAAFSTLLYTYICAKTGMQKDTPSGNLLSLSITNIIMTAGAVIISVSAKKNPRSGGALRLWISLFTVPAVTLVTLAVYQYYVENYPQDNKLTLYTAISCAGLLFINFLVFFLFRRLMHQLDVQRNADILTSQLALQEDSIRNLETAYNRTRAFRHDIKNHILLMNMLAEQEKYDELKNYLKDMSGVIDESSYVRISGISAVDAILNEKLYEAQSNSISTEYDVVNLDKNSIKPIDMCIILSNALDNAIEANVRISDPDRRFIKLKIHGNETFSVISVSNPTDSVPKKDGAGGYATTKEDADSHGFGLKSIGNTVEKYKGEMLSKCENGIFTIVVRLNSP